MDRVLMAGTGKLMITPPFGCEMSGFVARNHYSQGIHDPLWARALVLADGHAKLAVVSADLLGIDCDLIAAVRREIAALTDIAPDSLILGATHTHSGPAILADAFLGTPDPHYLAVLAKNIAGAVCLANQALEPMQFSVGVSDCRSVAKNRLKDPGSIDPQVLVACFHGPKGIKALLVNYACHPVVLGPDNLLISGDYPFYLIDTLERVYPEAQVMFVNGATGDLNVGHKTADSIQGIANPKRTFAEAERIGKVLAGEALRAVAHAVPSVKPRLTLERRAITLPLEALPTAAEYQNEAGRWEKRRGELQARSASYGEIRQAELWRQWAERMALLAEAGTLPATVSTEIAALSFGETELVTFPGEFFHEFGLAIKQARWPHQVFIMGYCNGDIGYVAPGSAYAEESYEVTNSFRYYGLPARLAQGGGEKIIAELLEMLGRGG